LTDSIKGRAWKFWLTNLDDAEIKKTFTMYKFVPKKGGGGGGRVKRDGGWMGF